MPDTPAKVRDACDRCHSKKMRCERTGASCGRCQQAGVRCIFSPRTPYNSSRRHRNAVHPSRRSSLGVRSNGTSASESHTEPAVTSIQTPRSLEDWNIDEMDLAQVNCVDTLNPTTTTPPQFCPQPPPTDLSTAWMNSGAFNFDFTIPTTPALQQASNSLLSPASSGISAAWEQNSNHNGHAESGRHLEQTHAIADLSAKIFNAPGANHASDHGTPDSSFSDQSLPHAEFYCHTFGPSQAFVQALNSFGDSPSSSSIDRNSSPMAEVDDSEFLLVLACYLKLLNRYDSIFSCWLPLVEPELHEQYNQTRSTTLRDTILRVLPPNSVASILAPTCYVAQLRLIIEISHKMYHGMSQSLESVAEKISGRARSGAAGSVSHISDTTLELVMGRERMVRAKKNKLMGLIENSRLRESMESHFSLLQGGDSL